MAKEEKQSRTHLTGNQELLQIQSSQNHVELGQRQTDRSMKQNTQLRGHSYITQTFDSRRVWHCSVPCISHSRKEAQCLVGTVPGSTVPGSRDSIFHVWVNCSNSYTEDVGTASSEWGHNSKGVSIRCRLQDTQFYHLGHLTQPISQLQYRYQRWKKMLCGLYGNPQCEHHHTDALGSQARPSHMQQRIRHLWINSCRHATGLVETEYLTLHRNRLCSQKLNKQVAQIPCHQPLLHHRLSLTYNCHPVRDLLLSTDGEGQSPGLVYEQIDS